MKTKRCQDCQVEFEAAHHQRKLCAVCVVKRRRARISHWQLSPEGRRKHRIHARESWRRKNWPHYTGENPDSE